MVQEAHFRHVGDLAQCAALFKHSVQFVEIEIHSYCNRICDFCGNSFIDRRTHKTPMDPALYSRIMDDLSSIDYEGVVWYSRYNEPTADREMFLDRLREARAKLPNAKLQTFTNGDYLTAEYIEAIRDAGLNKLNIMTYLAKGEEPSIPNFLNTMVPRLHKLGLRWQFVDINKVVVDVPGIEVTYNFDDFSKIGTNRGGALASGHVIDRQSPCTIMFTDVYIDHNGSMVPCCDIRSDYDAHKNCVAYKLTPQNSIFEGYANSKLVQWRRDNARFGPKKFPCNSCSRRTFPATPEMLEMFGNIAIVADAIARQEEQIVAAVA
jgi:hypothetical protein